MTEEQKLVEEARRIADACDMDFCSLEIAAAWIRKLADALVDEGRERRDAALAAFEGSLPATEEGTP